MKTILVSLLIFVYAISLGQNSTKETPITSGTGNEFNPSFAKALVGDSTEWLVFERLTIDSSFIVGKKFSRRTGTWDPAEVIVSGSAKNELQKYPELASKPNYSMAVWQRKTGTTWNIFSSVYAKNSQRWSSPSQLTNDTLDNVNVRIQMIPPDSQFVIAWQNKNIIRFRKLPFGGSGTIDTIAVSNFDSTEFDLGTASYGYNGTLLYTIRSANKNQAVSLPFTWYPAMVRGTPDTVRILPSVQRPRFVQSYNSTQKIVFQSSPGIASDIYILDINSPFLTSSTPFKITNSASAHASYTNARMFFDARIAIQEEIGVQGNAPYNSALAFECRTDTTFPGAIDTSLIIMQHGPSDSITSSGFNQNPAVGSFPFSLPPLLQPLVPVVWESNRSGTTHLYGKLAQLDGLSGAPSYEEPPTQFTLLQNYPNPFNPKTVIRYHLPAGQAGLSVNSSVMLKVFDLLGREVATLVNERQSAGTHTAEFSGNVLSSGMYFYQLRAGTLVETKKMMLVK